MRRQLQDAVKGFKAVQMWTLTIDPSLFESPEQMMDYLSSKRCVAELVRSLRDQGHLLSDRYFCAIEFHQSGWPHFHLLLETKFIKKSIVQQRWDLFRPREAGPPPLGEDRPGFGWVRFSPDENRKLKRRPELAVGYVTKYLTKHPDEGYPEWVLQSRKRIVRYRHSQGLFAAETPEPKPMQLGQDPADGDGVSTCCGDASCFCRKCRRLGVSTIGERIARCGQESNAFNEYPLPGDSEKRTEFRSRLRVPFDDLKRKLDREPTRGTLYVTPAELISLEREFGSRLPLPEAMLPRDVEGTPSEAASANDERMQNQYAEEQARRAWREQFGVTQSRRETGQPSPSPEPTGEGSRRFRREAPAARQATLACPLALDDGCDERTRIDSVGNGLVLLRDVHRVTGDPAWELLSEAIGDLGDDVSRRRWGWAVADALAGLLGDDADFRQKGEAA